MEQSADINMVKMKSFIFDDIELYNQEKNGLLEDEKLNRNYTKYSLIREELKTQLSIPVLSNFSPRNPMQFVASYFTIHGELLHRS